jgi:hypothetical protein
VFMHPKQTSRRTPVHRWRPFVAFAMALLLLVAASSGRDAFAKAPPFATTVFDVEAYAEPTLDSAVVAVIPGDSQVELTGDAAPGFLAVYDAGEVVWVPAQYLALSNRPGIDTAVATQDTPLLDAPLRDARVLSIVPEGDAVILTGARVDGYDAASHEGTGGWINDRHLDR